MNRNTHKILCFLMKKFFACAPSCGKIFMSRKVEKRLKIERVFEVAPRVFYTSEGRPFGSQLCNLSRQLVQVL